MWPEIPNDVVDDVRMVVRLASDQATEQISNQPNIGEHRLCELRQDSRPTIALLQDSKWFGSVEQPHHWQKVVLGDGVQFHCVE